MKLNRKKNSIEKKYGKVSDVSYFSLTETWKLDILSEKYGDNKLFACPHIKKKSNCWKIKWLGFKLFLCENIAAINLLW